jgi:two-component system, cell cycle sensor histidine kinase and response regulator CckA
MPVDEWSESDPERLFGILKAVNAIHRALAQGTDLATAAPLVCEALTGGGACRAAWLAIDRPAENGIDFGFSGFSPDLAARLRSRFESGDGVPCAARADQSGATVAIPSGRECEGCPGSSDDIPGARLAARLWHGGVRIGLLAAILPAGRDAGHDECRLFEELAEAVAIGVGQFRARTADRREKSRYRSILDALPHPVSLVDRDYRYAMVNDAYLRIFRKPPSEIEGRPVAELLGKADFTEKVRPRLDECFSGKPVSFGEWFTTPGPSYREMSYTPLLNAAGEVHGAAVFGQDRTEQIDAERALAESERRYRQVFEASPVSLWEQDFSAVKKRLDDLEADGMTDFRAHFTNHPDLVREIAGLVRVVDVNTATLKLYRAESKADFYDGIGTVFSEESYSDFAEALITVAAGRTSLYTEKVHKTLDGEILEVKLWWSVAPGFEATYGRVLVSVLDVTDLNRARRRSQENEARYRALSEATREAVFVSEDGYLVEVNRTACEMFGYRYDELIGRFGTDLIAPGLKDMVRHYMLSGYEAPYEALAVRRDGRAFYVEIRGRMTQFMGRPARITVVGDIDQRKRAEEALRESERKYRTLFMSAPVGIFQSTPAGRYRMVNPTFAAMLGFSGPEEMVERVTNIADLYIDPSQRETVKRMLAESGRITGYEIHLRRLDGAEMWMSIFVRSVLDSDGEIDCYDGFALDVTDRKRAEMDLERSRQRLTLAARVAAMGIWELELETYRSVWDRRMFEIWGLPPGEAVTFDQWSARLHPEDRDRMLASIQNVVSEGRTRSVEFRIVRPDGEVRTVQASAGGVFSDDGTLLRLIGVNLDVTNRKRMEAELQQAEKMEAIGTLAGGIAHDFNNILMGIAGRVSLMEVDTEPESELRSGLEAIQSQIRRATELTRQLLGFARGGKYEVAPTDLNRLVREAAGMFGRTRKQLRVQTRLAEDLRTVSVDRHQIDQVILNLLVNAGHAMPDGGDLILDTENVMLDDPYVEGHKIRPGRYVKLSVTDTGVGMDPTTRQRIFEPFFTTRKMGRGTGLGLASAYGIIKNHKGAITVYSEIERGTTFNVYLPAVDSVPKPDPKPLQEEPVRGTETVLLVDDEDFVLDITEKMLTRLGYEVITAGGGIEAVESYAADPDRFDLVILDMIMPDMGGGPTFDRLREIRPAVKVLLASGYSINGQAESILERGCNGFIQKPYTMAALAGKVREVLDSD